MLRLTVSRETGCLSDLRYQLFKQACAWSFVKIYLLNFIDWLDLFISLSYGAPFV